MNILYIIGNGFDKAQGLATLYKEFYANWFSKKPASPLEEKVLSSIAGDYDSWADLEEALGRYSSSWESEEEFRSVLTLFSSRLRQYLIGQEERIEVVEKARTKLINDLCQPEKELEPRSRLFYENRVYGTGAPVHVSVVSFNYTRTFEKVLGKNENPMGRVRQNLYYYDGILHIHGTLDDLILLGVNDESQIENVSFRENEFLRKSFIKPEINEGCMNTRNLEFSRKIREAQVIALFGVSLGVTDNLWWHAIGERMNSKDAPLLIYYPYDPSKKTEEFQSFKSIWCDQYIDFLCERMQFVKSRDLKDRVLIGINKEFLKLI